MDAFYASAGAPAPKGQEAGAVRFPALIKLVEMRIFVVFEDTRFAIDILPGATVKDVKDTVAVRILPNIREDKKQEKILDVTYGGASLKEDWILQDIGIISGSTVRCAMKVVQKPKFRVILGYSDEVFEMMDDINPSSTTFHEIRSRLSRKLGLPVGAYRLSLVKSAISTNASRIGNLKRDPAIELYDCNTLEYYGLDIGATVKLDVWDGWAEFVRFSLLGHEKMVDQFLSWEEAERHFQRRVALQIAAHFGYIRLASSMLRAGTRPDIRVGSHPIREWCSESDHVETKKCPVHEACESGNLSILRLFLKNNILCFVARDGKGRTPWQIVIEHFHKDCFEYLLARQWGRKTGKDVSLPLLTYCKILQWCERARSRALLLHGTAKSTHRGRSLKQGALVGNGVAVDGLSTKSMSSRPLAAMPKPTANPKRLLPALARARRRFRRQKSSVVFHDSAFFPADREDSISRTRPALSRRTSSKMSLQHSSSSPSLAEESSSSPVGATKERGAKNNDKENAKYGAKSYEGRKFSKGGRMNAAYISTGTQDSMIKSFQTAKSSVLLKNDSTPGLPPIRPSDVLGNERPLAIQSSRVSWNRVWKDSTATSDESTNKSLFVAEKPDAYGRRNAPESKKEVTIRDSKVRGIPLPYERIQEYRKPYVYCGLCGCDGNPVEVTLSRFESYRGEQARDNAIRCLTLTSAFTEKPWLKQLDMAVCLARRGVIKDLN